MQLTELSFDCLYDLGERYFQSRHYHRAQTILHTLLLRDASQARAHNLYGLALAHDPASRSLAEACFINAIHLDSENLEYRRNLAELAGVQELSESAKTLLYGNNAESCLKQRETTKSFAEHRRKRQDLNLLEDIDLLKAA